MIMLFYNTLIIWFQRPQDLAGSKNVLECLLPTFVSSLPHVNCVEIPLAPVCEQCASFPFPFFLQRPSYSSHKTWPFRCSQSLTSNCNAAGSYSRTLQHLSQPQLLCVMNWETEQQTIIPHCLVAANLRWRTGWAGFQRGCLLAYRPPTLRSWTHAWSLYKTLSSNTIRVGMVLEFNPWTLSTRWWKNPTDPRGSGRCALTCDPEFCSRWPLRSLTLRSCTQMPFVSLCPRRADTIFLIGLWPALLAPTTQVWKE